CSRNCSRQSRSRVWGRSPKLSSKWAAVTDAPCEYRPPAPVHEVRRWRAMTDSVARENGKVVPEACRDLARGDVPKAMAAIAHDLLWHVRGRGPLSRDYRGHQEVLGFFQHFMELSSGTFRIHVDDVLAQGDRVIALVTESAERKGKKWSSP